MLRLQKSVSCPVSYLILLSPSQQDRNITSWEDSGLNEGCGPPRCCLRKSSRTRRPWGQRTCELRVRTWQLQRSLIPQAIGGTGCCRKVRAPIENTPTLVTLDCLALHEILESLADELLVLVIWGRASVCIHGHFHEEPQATAATDDSAPS